MFFWIIIVFSSREEKFFFTCEEKFFHTLSLIKGCEEKKSERLENGYCPVEKTMIIQEIAIVRVPGDFLGKNCVFNAVNEKL